MTELQDRVPGAQYEARPRKPDEATVESIAMAICASLGWYWEDQPNTSSDTQERCRKAAKAALAAYKPRNT